MSVLTSAASEKRPDWARLAHAIGATLLMVGAVLSTVALTPTRSWFDELGRPNLEQIVPHAFGDWVDTGGTPRALVNPEQAEQLRLIYNQTLARIYMHRPSGHLLMISLAHGADQTYATQLHRPEMCYRAQGFDVYRQQTKDIATNIGTVETSRLWTRAGTRNELVSYWVRTGDRVTRGSLEMNLARIALDLRGFTADGLLFRVSEITADDASSFRLQEQFMRDLIASLQPAQRAMLLGSSAS